MIVDRAASERSTDVFDRWLSFSIERNRDSIETHRGDAFVFQKPTLPQCFTCRTQTFAFGARDAVECSLVRAGATSANFNDHDNVVFLNEQIDLGAPDVQVSIEDGIS